MSAQIPSLSTLKAEEGHAYPFGTQLEGRKVNYAVYAPKATGIVLKLFDLAGTAVAEIALDPTLNRTGHVWHVKVNEPPLPHTYAFDLYEKGGKEASHTNVLDPRARALHVPTQWRHDGSYQPRGLVDIPSSFDWQEDSPPEHHAADLLIYEMHVRGFTQGRHAESPHAGSFLGIIEQIPYLTSLGVNAIELLPIFEFHEQEYTGPEGFEGGPLCNYWGYSPVSFFAPMARYASPASPLNPIEQFKLMVRELHKAEIEVILDVVYNHTAEGHKGLESYCYRAWDADSFYIRDSEGHDLNYTGVGNTFNCNHPVAMELILDSLRYWVSEMHVDGFRFDLASIMMRDLDGTPLDTPPLVQAITKDPILAKCKLIAEPWDAAGLYHVGGFFSHSSRWSEWNGKYRDCVRRFLKGNPGMAGEFAKRLCGSEDLYGHNRTPAHSINFITAHDGFSLSDLVSYTHKHNLANGEENRDGSNMNDSWNCGAEGVSSDPKVLELRARQVRNFHLALMLSQGVPMIQMGDEYGHSKRGNNNTWCQDNYLSWFDWDAMDAEHGFQRFFRGLIQFRQRSPILRRREFLGPEDICWHGIETNSPAWDPQARLVAFTLYDHDTGHDLYAAFNAHPTAINVHLPARTDRAWHRLVDTSLESPMDFQEAETAGVYQDESYEILPFSSVLLRAQ